MLPFCFDVIGTTYQLPSRTHGCTVGPRLIGPIGTEDFSPSGSHLRGEITLKTIIWDLKRLTFIDGKPLKAGLLLRGFTIP